MNAIIISSLNFPVIVSQPVWDNIVLNIVNMPVYSSWPTTSFSSSASCCICMCKLPPLGLIQIPKSLFHSFFPFIAESHPLHISATSISNDVTLSFFLMCLLFYPFLFLLFNAAFLLSSLSCQILVKFHHYATAISFCIS